MTPHDPIRVLVLGHDATRTGAPLVLLHLLEWAQAHRGVSSEVVLRRGGPLVEPLRRLGPVRAPRPAGRRSPGDLVEAVLSELGAPGTAASLPAVQARLRAAFDGGRPDLVIVNGMGGASLLPLAPNDVPVAVLVHEFELGMARAATVEHQRRLWARADRLVAVSEAVAALLRRQPGTGDADVRVAPGFVEPRPAAAVDPVTARRSLGLPEPERPLVGAVGTGQWRKGIDLFAQVATELGRGPEPMPRLAWIGPVDHEDQVRHDLDRGGVADEVVLIGAVDDTGPWYPALDVVVSTAREDPFPLIGLEAGAAARPMVSFDSGGLAELLADGRGRVVAPLDVGAMAEQVRRLLTDPIGAARTGRRLHAHVTAEHLTEVGAPRLWDALTRPGSS